MYKIKKSNYLKASYIFIEMHSNDKKLQLENEINFLSPPMVVNKFRTRKNVGTVSEKTKKRIQKEYLK
jgi:hypothetical protein